jgi:tRNA 2-thiocytidine biosynthesis protein TtcA
MKKVLGCIRRADNDFDLISDGDHVVIGVSGGKDSLLLLRALRLYQYFSKASFKLTAATLDMGMDGLDFSAVQALCDELGIEYIVRKTGIARIVFDERKEKNPCSLCANLRRGALNSLAVEMGANKVALGHHREDLLETLFLSLLFEGRLHTFSPKTYLTRSGITAIRPMIYLPEAHVITMVQKLSLPIVHNPCPANGHTKRQDMKELLEHLCTVTPDAKEKLLRAIRAGGVLGKLAQASSQEDI